MQGECMTNGYSDRAISKGVELPPGYFNVQSSTAGCTVSCSDCSDERGFFSETRIVPEKDRKSMIFLTYAGIADLAGSYSEGRRAGAADYRPEKEIGFRSLTRKIPRSEMKKRIHTTYSEFADGMGGKRKDLVDLVEDPSVDMVSLDSSGDDIGAFDRRTAYNSALAGKSELGLSLEKAVDSDGRERFVHLRRYSSDSLGVVVSADYVQNAFRASGMFSELMGKHDRKSLKKALGIARKYFTDDAYREAQRRVARRVYTRLLDRGDWDSLKKAMQVAVKYFDSVKGRQASRLINNRLDDRAVTMADDAIAGCLNPETSKEVYDRLVKMKRPSTLSKALDLARLYMNREAVEDTADLLRQQLELKSMENDRDVRSGGARGVAADERKEGTRVSDARHKVLKPILYMPAGRKCPVREVRGRMDEAEVDRVGAGRAYVDHGSERLRRRLIRKEDRITRREAQRRVDIAEAALRQEFMKRGGNVLTERLRRSCGSTLPPRPDMETYLAPPTIREAEFSAGKGREVGKNKAGRGASTLPPHPARGESVSGREVKRMYERPVNLGEPPTKRILRRGSAGGQVRAA